MKEPKKQFNMNIDATLHQAFKQYALKQKKPMCHIVTDYIKKLCEARDQ